MVIFLVIAVVSCQVFVVSLSLCCLFTWNVLDGIHLKFAMLFHFILEFLMCNGIGFFLCFSVVRVYNFLLDIRF